MQWIRQLFSRKPQEIPPALWHDAVGRMPFLDTLPAPDLARLKQLSELLLHEKPFTGAGGLEISDDIAVMIAAQAALPVLNLTPRLYDDMAGIIVYPSAFILPQSDVDEAGVVHEWQGPASGEAIDAGGAVVLSWEDVEETGIAGFNVVIHEFAHKIDMAGGGANGCPPFLAEYHQGLRMQEWSAVFSVAFDAFADMVEWMEHSLPPGFDWDDPDNDEYCAALLDSLPMDPYGADHPAEFFAVASEAFFVRPEPLQAAFPEVYRLLSRYFLQDPLQRASGLAAGKSG